MRIAHLSAEVYPFARTGGLGDVVGALPAAQAELGHDVSVWMPLYRQVRDEAARRRVALEQAGEPFRVDLGFETHDVGLLRSALPRSRVPVFFIDASRFFDRPFLYSKDPGGRDDGLYRYAVFVRAALEAMKRLHRVPDLFHAHDWHAALVPMALTWDRPGDRQFAHSASVFTIHNLAFQGVYDRNDFIDLGLPRQVLPALIWHDRLNLVKGAALAADVVTAVSPTFAREMTTPEGGFGLDAVFRFRGESLVGIVNGVDRALWNPAVDSRIPRPYGAAELAGKAESRRALLHLAGMELTDPGFVIGAVGRLTEQKGYDLAFSALGELVCDGIRFMFLGAGDPHLESAVRAAAARAPGRVFGYVGFDDTLAHLVLAGSDAFLMPSRFEPCGLSQLYALADGTLPIVRRVGGLVDTVVPYDGTNAERATGFGFDAATPEALRDAVRWAHRCFADRVLWERLVRNGMAQDFSWERSARTYLDLYARKLSERCGGASEPALASLH